MKKVLIAALILTASPALAAAQEPPQAESVADGVWLIPGGFPEGRQPDGNTVIFRGKTGLVIMDTGRHGWHRRAIRDFVATQKEPVTAIVNSHWHLDHISGNPDLKSAWPGVKVHAAPSLDEALKGFIPDSVRRAQDYLDSGQATPELRQEIEGDMATLARAEQLKPDVAVTKSGTLEGLELKLAVHAATEGDVWLYDTASKVAAVGDLVTLPVPFLDTACVFGWKTALDQVWATDFTTVIPGHGKPMTRPQFATWRLAFNSFIDCAHGKSPQEACAREWTRATAALRDRSDDARTEDMAVYYVQMLRGHGGDSPWCATRKARVVPLTPGGPME